MNSRISLEKNDVAVKPGGLAVSSIRGLRAVVLAAGLGKRMHSKKAKVLHEVAGRPMVVYMVELATHLADGGVAVVIGHQGDAVRAVIQQHFPQGMGRSTVNIVEQGELLGTGHAVLQTKKVFQADSSSRPAAYLIMNGDTPLLTEATIHELWRVHHSQHATVSLLSALLDHPTGYGRVIRASSSSHPDSERTESPVIRIVEERDANDWEARVREINVGTYLVDGDFLFDALENVQPSNAQQEYYLTDLVGMAVERGLRVAAVPLAESGEGLGINSRSQLVAAEQVLRQRVNAWWMDAGVTILDPATTWIGAEVIIGRDTILHPHVTLEGHTRLGEDCIVRSHSRLTNCTVGSGVLVQDSCVAVDSFLDDEVVIGPFAHLRPGSRMCRKAKVGNFVEIKQTELGEGAKANHLSYLGNATVGKHVNIGAGTITCNYDGVHKHTTDIGENVFIGSDTLLIAPVTVGDGSLIAAGTIVTSDVPDDALAISRAPQVNRPGWASKRRALLEEQKDSSTPLSTKQGAQRPSGSGSTSRAKKKK